MYIHSHIYYVGTGKYLYIFFLGLKTQLLSLSYIVYDYNVEEFIFSKSHYFKCFIYLKERVCF